MADVPQKPLLDETSPSVQTHLGIMQGVIERMATNSSSSKAWCITIVSAVLVVVADKDKPNYALLAFIPAILFFLLDTYYLALEKGFRAAYEEFVRKVHTGTLTPNDLYSVKPAGNMWGHRWKALQSFSVWGFYVVIGIMIGLARWVVLP